MIKELSICEIYLDRVSVRVNECVVDYQMGAFRKSAGPYWYFFIVLRIFKMV